MVVKYRSSEMSLENVIGGVVWVCLSAYALKTFWPHFAKAWRNDSRLGSRLVQVLTIVTTVALGPILISLMFIYVTIKQRQWIPNSNNGNPIHKESVKEKTRDGPTRFNFGSLYNAASHWKARHPWSLKGPLYADDNHAPETMRNPPGHTVRFLLFISRPYTQFKILSYMKVLTLIHFFSETP